jgi:hypothetical protein
MNHFNSNLCHSIKGKHNKNEQCCNKPKPNEKLCGVHLKSKNVIFFCKDLDIDKIFEKNIMIDDIDIKDIDIKNIEDKEKISYTKEDLFDNILQNKYLSVYNIRQSIKNCGLSKIINTKQSKPELIKAIKKVIESERYYVSNEKAIILIQSYFRRWLIFRRKICSNDSDILTFTDKYDIPDKYFYIFGDESTNKKYAYDIRTLLEIINSEYKSCPYTFRAFTNDEMETVSNHANRLIRHGIKLEIEKQKLSPEEEVEMKMKDIFHQINMLDNYTNHTWFKNLNLYQLIELYIKVQDIWAYRSEISLEAKKKIIKNGIAFDIPIPIIKTFKTKIRLQNIILDEFNRFTTEGIDRDEKKLGAILVLTGLVEVSHEAAEALPHLIQI